MASLDPGGENVDQSVMIAHPLIEMLDQIDNVHDSKRPDLDVRLFHYFAASRFEYRLAQPLQSAR